MKKKLLSLAVAAVMAVAFVGCGSTSEPAPQTNAPQQTETNTPAPAPETPVQEEAKLSGTVVMIGSTTVQPVAQEIADAFESIETGVSVEVQGVGSSAGVKAADDGTADIGMSSRELKTEEKDWGLTEHVLAFDGIAVVVHPSNSVADLDLDTIKKIFEGEIKNWNEVGGNDAEILVVSREAGSGTRGAFEEIMKLEKEVDGKKVSSVREDALIGEGNGSIKANIAGKENAIGYLSLGILDESVKAVDVGGVEATIETVKSGAYKISRPLLLLTKGDLSPEVQAYIDFALSAEGQKIVGGHYITVH